MKIIPIPISHTHSLGEAYLLQGNKALALKAYQKSIALNPLNEEAGRRIGELEKER